MSSNVTLTAALFVTVLDTPTSVTATRTGYDSLKLSWTAPASNTSLAASYEVFYAVSDIDSTWSGGTTTYNVIRVVLPTLDVTYDFFVVAYSNVANTLPSIRSNSTTINLSEYAHSKSKIVSLLDTITIAFNAICLTL